MPPIHHVQSGLRALAAASTLVVLFATSAYAVDGNAVAARLKVLYGHKGGTLEYSGVETQDTTVILRDTKLSAAGMKQPMPVGDITLSDVAEVPGGGFEVGALAVPDINYAPADEPGTRISARGISLQGLTLPPEGATEPLAQILQYEKAEVKHVAVNRNGKDVFVADGLTSTISPLTATSPVAFTSNIASFKADLSDIEDPKTKDALTALGYETISGKVDIDGTWNAPDGRLNLESMNIIADNAGTLDFKFDISGYTLDFIKGMQEASKNADGKDDKATNMAMLGLLQQLSFTGASIRFDDGSLTNKALDYIANKQNAKRSDLISQTKMILPMAAAQLGDAEFAQSLATAVNGFLDDPKTIEIKAAPAKPVPFAIIAAGGMADPKSLIKTLAVSVRANQ
jgi:hypothetical protein